MKKLLVFSLVLLFSTGLLFADSNKENAGLVSVQWLKKHQNDDNLVLIDISKKEPFEQGHVAGAILSSRLIFTNNNFLSLIS